MKLQINVDDLRPILEKAVHLCKGRATLDILKCVHISGKITIPDTEELVPATSEVILQTTDLEVDLTAYLEADLYEEGSLCINAVQFLKTIKSIKKGTVLHIESLPNFDVKILSNKLTFTLSGSDPSDFPALYRIDYSKKSEAEIGISKSMLMEFFDKTLFAIVKPRKEGNYGREHLMHVCLTTNSKGIYATTSDGIRVAHMAYSTETYFKEENSFLLTIDFIEMLKKTFKPKKKAEAADWLNIYVQDNRIFISSVTSEGITISTRKPDYTFPNWKALLKWKQPKEEEPLIDPETAQYALLDIEELTEILKVYSSIVADHKPYIYFDFGEATSRVRCETEEKVRTEGIIENVYHTFDESKTIGFNVNYVLDALSQITDPYEMVAMLVATPHNAEGSVIVFLPIFASDAGLKDYEAYPYYSLLMQVRIRED